MKRKAQGISINMIVIIALAVFVVFLVMGFVTGGWSYFAGAFKGATGGTGGSYDAARIRCDQWCETYKSTGSGLDRMNAPQNFGYDANGDGDATNDCFQCIGDAPGCEDEVISGCVRAGAEDEGEGV